MTEGGCQPGQCHLVHPERPTEGVPSHGPDDIFLPQDDSSLRPPKEFISRDGHGLGPTPKTLGSSRLRGQSQDLRIGQEARPQVVEEKEAQLPGQNPQLGDTGLLGEAGNLEVRAVDLEDGGHATLFRRFPVILQAGPVGGAHFPQDRPGP